MSGQAIQALGWSLIHFLWQGALVALLLEVALCLLREHSPRVRYAVRCAALILMGLLPLATWAWLARAGAPALTGLEPVLEPIPARIEEYLAAVVAAEEAARRGQTLGWLVAAWALGASLCTARMLRDYLRIRRLQSSAAGRALPPAWQVRFDFLARRLCVRATARVVESAALAAPAVVGWLRPVVLIPARALTGLSGAELELVLGHELAHVARADYLVNLLQSALEALLFYHPAVWWVSQGIRTEREFCCDDAALARSGDGVVYARALTTLEGWRSVEPALGLSTLGGPLMIRIQRLIGIRPSTRPMRGPLSALGALLALGGATAMAHDPAQSSSADRIAALRQQVEEMQQRLDELRASLEDETQGTEDVVEVRRPRFAFPARVAVRGDGEEECTEEGCEEHEQAKKEVRAVVIDGDDLGEWREWAGKDLEEKIRGHVGHVREHLQHLGHSGDDGEVEVDGEATIEIIIQTDDGPPRHIKKQIPIDGNGFKMLWRGDDEEGEDGDHPMRFDWSDGSPQHWKLGGHPFLFQHGDEDDGERKVHVLELNKLLDESTDSEDLEKIEKIIGGRVEELLQTHGQGLEHGIGDHEHLLKLHELLEKKLHGKLEDKVKVKVLPKLKVLKHGEDVPVLIEVRPDDAPEASAGTREVI